MNGNGMVAAMVAAAGTYLSGMAAAQEKPAPALIEPEYDLVPDYQGWANAYVQAGEPEIAVVVFEASSKLDRVTLESLARTISGNSIPAKLRSAIMQELQTPPADVQVVDTEFAIASAKRLGSNLRQADDPEALRLLGREMNAQLYVQVRLVPSQLAGSNFSVLFEATNGVTGRSILNFQFDWKGGTEAWNINRNATQMVRKFVDTYIERANNPSRYTVRLFGLSSPQQTAAARKALMRVEGVTSVLTREENNVADPWAGAGLGAEGGNQIASLTRFELRLAPGTDADATALLGGIAEEVGAALSARVETMQTAQGAVAVRVADVGMVMPPVKPEAANATVTVDTTVTTTIGGKSESTTTSSMVEVDLNDPAWKDKLAEAVHSHDTQPKAPAAATPSASTSIQSTRAVIDPRAAARGARQMVSGTSVGRAMRADWLAHYQAKESPRILVLANRATTPREPLVQQQGNATTQVIVSANGLGSSSVTSGAAIENGALRDRPRWDDHTSIFEQPEQLAFQARALEGRIGAMFSNELLGATRIIDAEAAKGQFATELQQRETMGEPELMGLLKQRDIADIVVLGFGRVVARGTIQPADEVGWGDDDASARSGQVVIYTFKAIDLRDNRVLGFADATGLDDSFTTDGLSDMATRLVGKLGYDMLQQWK